MGIHGLTKLIRKYKKYTYISNFEGFKFALDVSCYMYIYKTCAKTEYDYFIRMIQIYKKFRDNGIKLIYIFDGAPPEEKIEERKKREERKKKYKINAPDARDFKILKRICKAYGIPYMQSKSEAEMLSSALFYGGYIDGVISRDSDHLAYGIGYVITKFSLSMFSDEVEFYQIDEILDGLSITFTQFVSMCVISGCDYSRRIRGIGIKRSYQYFKKYNSIYKFLEGEKDYIEKNKPEIFRPVKSFKIFVKKYKLVKEPEWEKKIISLEHFGKYFEKYLNEVSILKLFNLFVESFCNLKSPGDNLDD